MLHHTKVELELITDVDMLLFLESGIRGGLSYCATRAAAKTEDSSLVYLDANNLVSVNKAN